MDLKICRICLRTEAKTYKYDRYQLKSYYEEVMAFIVNEKDGLPQYFCYECAAILNKFHKFKEKCYCGQKALKEILWKGNITYESVYKIDRKAKNLQSQLDIFTVNERVKSYAVKYETTQSNSNEESENNIEDPMNTLNKCLTNVKETDKGITSNSPETLFIDVKKEVIKLETEMIKECKKSKSFFENNINYSKISRRRTRFLNTNNWKKLSLTEEEALKEFRARSEDSKYLKSLYKCNDCFKGFSKEEMLKRHVQLRHSDSLGSFECRLCRMRFKWDSHLRVHMRQHFIKYQCLRCNFICPLENSALLHEEYHSGVTRKCIHCDVEFKHASTYYTHLRTSHRSEYVCTVCGVSFVSETGLHQHKRIKHINNDMESPDDDEEINTYCERCDIRFDTRKAYEEHLFHSVMHADGLEHELKDEITIPRKVLSKRLRAKITKNIQKRKANDEPLIASNTKRRKKQKRKRRKPTTCHQCGKHFDTQSACMKHHIAEHPRTSFYPPTLRHICELCGASLAPGSVAVHQNMHTREQIYSCDTCGKQFHSSVGLRRHLVTHTGEKRFACSLCDKRFTQSNSMKLHYKTFHLKQPYPKRNRKKKKDVQDTFEVGDMTSEESDSLPEPDMGMMEQVKPVPNVMPDDIPEESVHYLTLM